MLLQIAQYVDVIEPVSKFTEGLKGKSGVRTIFNVGLEDWEPVEGVQYDLIWTQWCLGHLTDDQLVQYLKLCKSVLKPDDGLIVIKENISINDTDNFDETDSSVTRLVRTLFTCPLPKDLSLGWKRPVSLGCFSTNIEQAR